MAAGVERQRPKSRIERPTIEPKPFSTASTRNGHRSGPEETWLIEYLRPLWLTANASADTSRGMCCEQFQSHATTANIIARSTTAVSDALADTYAARSEENTSKLKPRFGIS